MRLDRQGTARRAGRRSSRPPTRCCSRAARSLGRRVLVTAGPTYEDIDPCATSATDRAGGWATRSPPRRRGAARAWCSSPARRADRRRPASRSSRAAAPPRCTRPCTQHAGGRRRRRHGGGRGRLHAGSAARAGKIAKSDGPLRADARADAGHPRRARARARGAAAAPGARRLRRRDRRRVARGREKLRAQGTSTSSSPTTCRATDAGFDVDTNAVTIIGPDGEETIAARAEDRAGVARSSIASSSCSTRRPLADSRHRVRRLAAGSTSIRASIERARRGTRDAARGARCRLLSRRARRRRACQPRSTRLVQELASGIATTRVHREPPRLERPSSRRSRRAARGPVARRRPRRRRSPPSATDIGDCTRCKLHTLGRTQIVFGVGNPRRRSDVRRRGAGRGRRRPGHSVRRPRRAAADEDHRGDRASARRGLHRQRHQVPAAGEPQSRAGRGRDLRAVPVPADRRDPAEGDRRARHVRGARRCSRPRTPISRLRGRVFDYRGAKLIPTFHPAFLLRSPGRKREVWEDMKKAARCSALGRAISRRAHRIRRAREAPMRLVRVAVPVPSARSRSTYALDSRRRPVPMLGLLTSACPRASTGRRVGAACSCRSARAIRSTGCVLGTADGQAVDPDPPSRGTIKPIIDVLDDEPFLPPDVVDAGDVGRGLLRVRRRRSDRRGDAAARVDRERAPRAHHGAGRGAAAGRARRCAATVLEALDGGRAGARRRAASKTRGAHRRSSALERDGLVALTQPLQGQASTRIAPCASRRLTAQGHDDADAERRRTRRRRQREALDSAAGAPDGLDASELARRGIGARRSQRLAELGLVAISRRRVERDPFERAALRRRAPRAVVLTAEQQAACDRLPTLAAASDVPGGAAARRDRQRQDRDLPAARGRRARAAAAAC